MVKAERVVGPPTHPVTYPPWDNQLLGLVVSDTVIGGRKEEQQSFN
jgi:hypothetical protein